MVPCDPVSYLDMEYGREYWKTPNPHFETKWKNVKAVEKWNENEWPHVLKMYDVKGQLLGTTLLDIINMHLNISINKLPADVD